MRHISIGKLTIIGSDNGLLPGWRQAIIWTNAGILFIGPLGTNFSEILINIYTFSFKKMHLKISSGKCRPFSLTLNVLNQKCIHSASVETNQENIFEIHFGFTRHGLMVSIIIIFMSLSTILPLLEELNDLSSCPADASYAIMLTCYQIGTPILVQVFSYMGTWTYF